MDALIKIWSDSNRVNFAAGAMLDQERAGIFGMGLSDSTNRVLWCFCIANIDSHMPTLIFIKTLSAGSKYGSSVSG